MLDFDLKDILVDWKVKYGEERIGQKYGNKYLVIPINERRNILPHLIETLRQKGCDRDYFKKGTFLAALVEVCFPPEIRDKAKRQSGVRALEKELLEVVSEVFNGSSDIVEAKKDVQLEADRQERSKSSEIERKKLQEKYEEYKSKISESEPEPEIKILDRSIFKDVPEPLREYDEEASKLLGFDDDE